MWLVPCMAHMISFNANAGARVIPVLWMRTLRLRDIVMSPRSMVSKDEMGVSPHLGPLHWCLNQRMLSQRNVFLCCDDTPIWSSCLDFPGVRLAACSEGRTFPQEKEGEGLEGSREPAG